ncbi:MAG: type II toxin-antitoxin system Phd/YefM family antitoxin [Acidobacteriota bacterium]
MKKASLTEAKNQLSALIDQVRQGEPILILDRGRPVAKLVSVLTEGPAPEGRLERLEREGLLRRAATAMPRKLLLQAPPAAKGDVLAALLAERAEGR